MISVDEALKHLHEARPDFGTETVPLNETSGRVLMDPIIANVSRPPADVSAMDGYAVRLDDVSNAGAKLDIIGEAPAGTPFEGTLTPGSAVRIFTGGEIPSGADHIVIQEDVDREDNTIVCRNAYPEPEFIRKAGRDFKTGDTLVPAGTLIGPAEIAVSAAANHAHLTVRRRPVVGILANGDELRAPGSDLKPGEIVNSNPFGLSALIQSWGGTPVDLGIAEDRIDAICEKIDAADMIDILLPIGGASVGDHDHMRAAFAEMGFAPVFQKIAVKPGKPTWFSKREKQLVLGLPGNPASAFVCAHLFLRALIEGDPTLQTCPAHLSAPLPANGPRENFLRAIIELGDEGQIFVHPSSDQDSSLITPFLSAGALIRRLPSAPEAKAGERVEIVTL